MRYFTLISLAAAVGLFLAMLLFQEIGRRLSARQQEKRGPAARAGVGIVDSAVYAVLALLLGFTFAGATSRFDGRRNLIIEEVSTISTAWSRLDALPEALRQPIRPAFQRYVDAVLASYATPEPLGSPEATEQQALIAVTQTELWRHAVAACLSEGGEPARMLVLPAMNEMFDVVDRERLARRIHTPAVIWFMLLLAALAASLFAGYSMGPTRNWLFAIGVAATISTVTYVIIELEFPRLGVIRVDAFDEALVELRTTLN